MRRAHRPKGYLGTACLVVLEVVLGLLAIALVIFGFVFWRLTEGPISLDFLTPYLEDAINDDSPTGPRLAIGETYLTWDAQRDAVEITVDDLTLVDTEGEVGLDLPETNLDFSIGELVRGEVVITEIEFVGAEVAVRHDPDGSFTILMAPQSDGEPDRDYDVPIGEEGASVLNLLDRLLGPRGPSALSGLNQIEFLDSRVVVDDRQLGSNWSVPVRQVMLQRSVKGLSGEIDVQLDLERESGFANIAFVYDAENGLLDAAGQVGDIDPSRLAELLPRIEGLANVESTISGDVSATLSRDGSLFFVDFELDLGRGRVWPALRDTPALPILGGTISGTVDLLTGALDVYEGTLHSGTPEKPGPAIAVTFNLTPQSEGASLVRVSSRAGAFDATELDWLWPPIFATAGQSWVTQNITAGRVRNGAFDTEIAIANGQAEIQDLKARFDFEDLTIHYLRPMPPITGLSGSAEVGPNALTFRTETGGKLSGLTLEKGTVVISRLDQAVPWLQIDSPVSGSVPDFLRVLDSPRLGLISKAGIVKDGSAGRGRGVVSLGIPLSNDVTFDAIAFHADGRFRDVKLRNVILGQDVEGKDLSLSVGKEDLRLTGQASMAGTPMQVDYTQNFEGELSLKGSTRDLRASSLETLIPAVAGRISGAGSGRLEVSGNPAQVLRVKVDSDLTGLGVSIPELEWSKQPAAGGQLSLGLVIRQGELQRINDIAFSAPRLTLKGDVALAEGNLVRADLHRAVMPGIQLSEVVVAPQGTGLRIDIGGGVFDARSYIKNPEFGDDHEPVEPPLYVSAPRFDRVILPNGELRQVNLSFIKGSSGIELGLSGRMVAKGLDYGALRLVYGPNDSAGRRLHLDAANVGALLSILDVMEEIDGGRLTLRAQTPPRQPEGALSGTLNITRFRIPDIPSGLKALMVATITGIGDVVSGSGLTFDRLDSRLSFEKGVLTIPHLRAYGDAIGVTTRGQVSIPDKRLNLEGVLVPASAVSRVLDQIPVVGWVLTGGENQGLLAMNYTAKGPLYDPTFTLHPLSALTPGFLRGLFESDAVPSASADESSENDSLPEKWLEPSGPQR